MGYETHYNLEWANAPDNFDLGTVIDFLEQNTPAGYYWPEVLTNIDAVKWYDYATDMLALSRVYPNITFVMTREGEEFGDFTKEYFLNGKHEGVRAELVYPDPATIQVPRSLTC